MPTTRLDPAFLASQTNIGGQNTGFRLGAADKGTFVSDVTFATGKVFFEAVMTKTTAGQQKAIGVVDSTALTPAQHLFDGIAGMWCYQSSTGNKREETAAAVAYGSTWAEGDIISVAFDVDNGHVWYAKNGVWQNGATDGEIAAGTTTNAAHVSIGGTGPYRLAVAMDTAGMNLFNGGSVNFGQFEGSMSIPSGYAFPDTVVAFPSGVPAAGNGWERWDWTTGAFGDGTVNTHPHPGVHVNSNDKTIEAVYGRSDGFITPIARTGTDLSATGKYYWEILIDDQGGVGTLVGFGEDTLTMGIASSVPSTLDGGSMNIKNGNMFEAALAFLGNHSEGSAVDTDVFGFAVDMAAGKFWLAVNNVYHSGGNPAAGTGETGTFTASGDMRVMTTMQSNVSEADLPTLTLQSNSGEYTFSAPSGFNDLPAASITHNGDGLMPMTMALSATGTAAVHHGNAVPAMTMAIGATGTNAVHHGNAVPAATMAIAATGSNVTKHGNALMPMTMALSATGSLPAHHGNALMPMTMAIAGTGVVAAIQLDGTLTLPALSVTGTIIRGAAGASTGTLPALQVTGTIVPSHAYQGSPRMPQLQIVGEILNDAQTVFLPAFTVTGEICNGPVLIGQATLPFLQVTGTILNPNLSTGTISYRALRVTGTIITGATISGSISLPALKVLSLLDGENLISGTLTMPFFCTDPAQAPIAAGSLGEGLVILPMLRLDGTIVNAAVLTSTVWAMNTESFETTNYLNFDFINLVSFNEQPYGVTDAGIFLLAGDDDDGTQIDAEFLSGIEDRDDEHLKEADALYMAYTGGNLVLRLFPDGQTRVREYPVERISNSTGVKHARFKGARGLRSRTFQLGIKNQGGADFKIDKMGALLRILTRKTRKN